MDDGGAGLPLPAAPNRYDFRFPPRFRWFGTQTAPTQVEGGGIRNSFTEFAEQQGRIRDGSKPNPGLDHWHRYREYYQQLGAHNHNAHGFSIDWGRVQPEPGGEFRIDVLDRYLDEIRTCRANGMEPMVTLLHFALPVWLSDSGGLLNPDMPALFATFVRACAEHFGDEVTWWNTINEPAVLACMGYFVGDWPPGETSVRHTFQALDGVLRVHAAGATALRQVAGEQGRGVHIAIAHHMRPMRPYRWWSPFDQFFARLPDYVLNHWFIDSCHQGRSLRPIGRGQEIPGLRDSLDYIGLNYYTRDRVAFRPRPFGGGKDSNIVELKLDPSRPISTFDWNVDPDGLFETTLQMATQFDLPVMITENGVADVNDELRSRYIVDHLAVLHHCLEAGVDLIGYLHWTDWDNWEWAQGFHQKFGMMGFDHLTGETWVKPSARVFADILRRRAIPANMLTAENRQSPADRDPYSRRALERLVRQQQQRGGALLGSRGVAGGLDVR